jgi:hypothetical protein
MADRKINTKSALLADIIPAWTALNEALEHLSERQKNELKDAHQWSVKDHLVHLAAWENSVVYLLQGKPRHEGLGVEEYTYTLGDEDVINAAIHKKNQAMTYRQAVKRLRDVHAHLMAQIEQMDNTALLKPYRAYLPDEPGEGEGPPVIALIYGNTAYHYNEHLDWINALLEANK